MKYLAQSTYKPGPMFRSQMKESGMDFYELFWKWILDGRLPIIIVDGYAYSYEEIDSPCATYDKHRYVLMTNPLRAIHIHRIIRIGKVPANIHNNAKLITKSQYTWYSERPNLKCNMKGCFDRYGCALYNKEAEREPWNSVPHDWKVGDELCELFTPYIC